MAKVKQNAKQGNSKGTDMQVSSADNTALALKSGYDALVKKSQEMEEQARFNKDNKDELVGMPFLIIGVTFRESDKYTDRETGEPGVYASCACMLPDNTVFALSDGSTGIAKQLNEWINVHGLVVNAQSPLLVAKGLRVSTYDKPELGIKGAKTYYLTGRSSAADAIERNRGGGRVNGARAQARA